MILILSPTVCYENRLLIYLHRLALKDWVVGNSQQPLECSHFSRNASHSQIKILSPLGQTSAKNQ